MKNGLTQNKNNPIITLLYLGAIACSAVSLSESTPYLIETMHSTTLGIAVSAILSVFMMVGFHIAIKHTGFIARSFSFAVGALALSASVITIYQSVSKPDTAIASDKIQQQYDTANSKYQKDSNTLTADKDRAQARVDALLAENILLTTTNNKVKARLTKRPYNIYNKHSSDRKKMAKSIASTAQLIKDNKALVAKKEITVKDFGKQITALVAPTLPKMLDVNSLENIDIVVLARSSFIDLAGLVLLIFAGFFGVKRKADENVEVQSLLSTIKQAQAMIEQQVATNKQSEAQNGILIAKINDAQKAVNLIDKTAKGCEQTKDQLVQKIQLALVAINQLGTADDVLKDANDVVEKVQRAGATVESSAVKAINKIVQLHDQTVGNIEQQKNSANKAKKELKTATTVAEKSINSFAGANKSVNQPANDLQMKNKEEEFFKKLENRKIAVSKKNLITPAIVQQALKVGRHKATQLIKKAIKKGKLVSINVSSGTSAVYPEKQETLNLENYQGLSIVAG